MSPNWYDRKSTTKSVIILSDLLRPGPQYLHAMESVARTEQRAIRLSRLLVRDDLVVTVVLVL